MISTRALQESPHRLGIILSSGKYSLCRSRHNEYLYAFPGGALFQPVYKGPRPDKHSPDAYASLKFKRASAERE